MSKRLSIFTKLSQHRIHRMDKLIFCRHVVGIGGVFADKFADCCSLLFATSLCWRRGDEPASTDHSISSSCCCCSRRHINKYVLIRTQSKSMTKCFNRMLWYKRSIVILIILAVSRVIGTLQYRTRPNYIYLTINIAVDFRECFASKSWLSQIDRASANAVDLRLWC